VHETAQLELDPLADRQPMQLKKAHRDMLASAQLGNQASSGVLDALQSIQIDAIVVCGRPASIELQ